MSNIKEKYKAVLINYIPPQAVDIIAEWILQFDFDLRITKERATKLGDYRNAYDGDRHKISVNHSLNHYAFLITLVHEIAHLVTYEKFKHRVKPHGAEWKNEFKKLMQFFFFENLFPADIHNALIKYMNNPAASSCSDTHLQRVLKAYDNPAENDLVLLESLPMHSQFSYNEDRIFIKGEQLRKRIKCKEIGTKREYLFSPLTEVKLLS